MAQTLTDILGINATATGSKITIDLSDFKDKNGVQILDSPDTATDAQKIATLVSGIAYRSQPTKDLDGTEVVDKTNVIVTGESFAPKTFEVREGEAQIKHEFILNIYTIDSTDFDPDNAI